MSMKQKTLLMGNGVGYVLTLDPSTPYGSVEIKSAVACLVKLVPFSLINPAPTAPVADPTPTVDGTTCDFWPLSAGTTTKVFGVKEPKGTEDGRFSDTIQHIVIWSNGAGLFSVDAQ